MDFDFNFDESIKLLKVIRSKCPIDVGLSTYRECDSNGTCIDCWLYSIINKKCESVEE